jgi:hypothetical protein
MNELAEKSWQEIQTAFGSAPTGTGSFKIPIGSMSADTGASMDHTYTNDMGFKKSIQNYYKTTAS